MPLLRIEAFGLATYAGQSGNTKEARCGNKLEDDVTRAPYLSANCEKAGCEYVSQARKKLQHTGEYPKPYHYFRFH